MTTSDERRMTDAGMRSSVAVRLWGSTSCDELGTALAGYEECVARQGSALLEKRDRWYRLELPAAIAQRPEPFVGRDEIVWVVEWKMARGVWRARNLHLARSNSAEAVEMVSRAAFAAIPDERAPLQVLGKLKGVGPATASAVLAAYRPDLYPFFDDVVADQIPGLVAGEFTVKAYLAYASALRARSAELAGTCRARRWTAQAVGLALWSAAGGKGP